MTAGTTPFWLDAPYQPRGPLEGDVEVDVCVIGGGVAGLSCARRLAQHGLGTVVIDAGTVAGGASGRNGGFLIAGVAAFHNDARERFGIERSQAMYARTLEAQRDIIELATQLGAGDALRQVGLLRLAVSEEEAAHVRDHAAALQADGFPGEVVEREDLPAALQRIGLVGCLTDHDCALHPARWYRLLADAAEAAGARIHEGTRAFAPVAAPGEGPMATERGSITAEHVVVAADGALPALVPEYAGRVRSRRLHMVATEPLPPTIETMVYARWGYEYLQQRPDGRILAGGFSDVDADDSYSDSDAGSPQIWERVESYLREDLGTDARISHRWAGVVGYSDDSLPYVGEVPGRPGLHVSGGYSGVGNVPGFMCGRDIADAIAGEPREPLFPLGPGTMDRIRELTQTEAERFAGRTTGSRKLAERARRSLAGGVTSSLHARDPYPIHLARGEGARVWDVDGNEYVDFHNGYSAMVQGHAHPAIATAVRERVGLGTHFGATTEDAVTVAEELSRRFRLPSWRFTNSGTESNMTAIRIARAATGRDAIVMMKRSYHGHAEFDHVHEVAFNDAAELERCLADVSPACVLMEGAMTSAGLIAPEPGYLKSVRELTRRNGALLIFDEVKTGLTIAAGGAVERFGVEPDLLTLAKSLGGGLPSGAIGMAPEPAGLVAGRQVRQAGTYNGNPLSMAAARASLLQVLTPAAYDELERLGDRMFDGCERVLGAAGIEAEPVGVGSKGCVHWRSGSDPLRGSDPGPGELIWLWLANRGVYTTPGREQEWNVTVAHDDEAVDRYLDVFGGLAAELTPRLSGSARA